MMFNRIAITQKTAAILFKMPKRQMSLLVPLAEKQWAPAEVAHLPITAENDSRLQEEYRQFNEQCVVEQGAMNDNLIRNIIARGGDEGWTYDATQRKFMTRDFEFNSFEQCQAFCQNVASVSNKLDHHPEWHVSQNGRVLSVKLTSHFAGNELTTLDYKLAEQMNNEYNLCLSSYQQFTRFSDNTWNNLKYGLASAAALMFIFKYYMSNKKDLTRFYRADKDYAQARNHHAQTGAAMVQSAADQIAEKQLDKYAGA